MPLGLKRYQHEGDDHFITFSCYRREAYFTTTASKDIFLDSLELTPQTLQLRSPQLRRHARARPSPSQRTPRPRSPPLQSTPVPQAVRLKAPHAETLLANPLLLASSSFTHNKRVEKLRYMHRNPVTRSLVEKPEDWPWSTYRHYLLDEPGPVRISLI